MKFIPSAFIYIIILCQLHANEDHLVLVPRPITIVGDEAEHTVIEVPYVSGYGLDFTTYCDRIASPHMVDVHSPSSKVKNFDINPLSRAGLAINAEENADGSIHVVTLDFSAVVNVEHQVELLKIATKCVYLFGDRCMSPFKTEFALKGVGKESSLHKELTKIMADRMARQDKNSK